MSRATATWGEARPGGLASVEVIAPVLVVLAVALLTLAAMVYGDGDVLLAMTPAICVAVVWAIAKSPIRSTLFVLFLVVLSVDRPGDAQGLWKSSFITVGALLKDNVSNTFHDVPIKLNGISLILLLLLGIRIHRMLMGRKLDVPGAVPPAQPMTLALAVSAATVVWLIAFGLLTGGNAEMAKIQVQVILPLLLLAFLLMPSLRVTRDLRSLATIIVTAACCKALLALWVRHVLPEAIPDKFGRMEEVDYMTSHGDSLLFSCAMMILLVPMIFQPTRRHLTRLLGLGALIGAGILANDRRLAWVELGMGVFLVLALSPKNWITRRLIRTLVLASPLLAVYIAAGWYLPQRVFRPVQILRSLVEPARSDGTIDRSTLFRDVENFNLVHTFRQNAVFGRGFGHQFDTPVPNDDMSGFKEYRYLPHNSMLGLMGFAGGLGVIGLFAPVVVGLFLAARALRVTDQPEIAMASAVVIANIAAYMMHVWGDIGFTELNSIFTVGTSFAVASQVAVASGAWRVAGVRSARTAVAVEGR